MPDPERPTTDVEELTAVLAERARESAGPDPEPGELLDYLEGRLSPAAQAEMERRLVASPSASRKLLDLADLAEAGPAADAADREEPADLAVHAAWRDFQGRLAGEAAEPALPDRSSSPRPAARGSRTLAALAAALFVAVLALGTWVWRLERSSAGAGDGLLMANLQSLDLFEPLRSGEVPVVEVAPGEPFRVALYPPERCPTYRVEILGPGAGRTRALEGLERDGLGLLTFLFEGQPGSYTLRLSGCERELSTHGFEILAARNDTSGLNGADS